MFKWDFSHRNTHLFSHWISNLLRDTVEVVVILIAMRKDLKMMTEIRDKFPAKGDIIYILKGLGTIKLDYWPRISRDFEKMSDVKPKNRLFFPGILDFGCM